MAKPIAVLALLLFVKSGHLLLALFSFFPSRHALPQANTLLQTPPPFCLLETSLFGRGSRTFRGFWGGSRGVAAD